VPEQRSTLAARIVRTVPVVVPVLTMLVLGLWGIGRNGTYSAEAVTYWAANLPLPRLFHLLRNADAFHGLYYFLVHLVFEFGRSQARMRILSVIGATAAVFLTYRLAWRLTRLRWLSFLAAMMLAVSPGMSEYAQDGRSYALDTMMTLLVSLALLRAAWPRERDGELPASEPAPSPGVAAWVRGWLDAWWPYIVLMTVCGYLQVLMAILLGIAHGVVMLVTRSPRSTCLRWALSGAVAGMLVAPLLLLSLTQAGAHPDKPPPGWADIGRLVRMDFGWSPVVVVLLMVLVVVGSLPRRPHVAHSFTPQSFAAPIAFVPFAALLLIAYTYQPLFIDRYLLFGLPCLMILAAVGVRRVAQLLPRPRRAAAFLCVGALVLGSMVVLQWGTQQWLRTPDSRTWNLMADASYLEDHAKPGDGVDWYPRSLLYTGLAYPWSIRGLVDYHTAIPPARAGTLHGIRATRRQDRHKLLSLDRVWLVTDPRKVSGHNFGLLARKFDLVSMHRLHNARIRLFVRDE
jgi:mannosyltransferase